MMQGTIDNLKELIRREQRILQVLKSWSARNSVYDIQVEQQREYIDVLERMLMEKQEEMYYEAIG